MLGAKHAVADWQPSVIDHNRLGSHDGVVELILDLLVVLLGVIQPLARAVSICSSCSRYNRIAPRFKRRAKWEVTRAWPQGEASLMVEHSPSVGYMNKELIVAQSVTNPHHFSTWWCTIVANLQKEISLSLFF